MLVYDSVKESIIHVSDWLPTYVYNKQWVYLYSRASVYVFISQSQTGIIP